MSYTIFDFGFEFTEIFDFSCIPRILSIHTDPFHVFSVYKQIHSAYSQYMNRFIPCILSIRTEKFRWKINLIPGILHIHTNSFRAFSVYEQIHSAYSQCTNRFIPHILSLCADSFHVFGECAQIISNIFGMELFSLQLLKGHYFKKVCMCAVGPTGINPLCGPSLTKKFLSAYSDNSKMTFEFEYLREFEFIFENNLG
jgi:hypothetical protein